MLTRNRHATSQAVEDDVHVALKNVSRTGSVPLDQASSQGEPQRRIRVSIEVVWVIVDVDVEFCCVAGNAVVVDCEMRGRLLSVVVVTQVEVVGVLLDVEREELVAEMRYERKAREHGVCAEVSAVRIANRIHEVIDSLAQLVSKAAEAQRRGHCGGGSLRGCSKAVGSGGSQCGDSGESSSTL